MEFDLDYLNNLVSLGYLNTQRHDTGLLLFDYTSKAQYDFAFKDHPILLNCRGLVLDEKGYTVAYPLPKFFNIEEVERYGLPNLPFDIYEKLDGSLGIVYYWDGNWRVNTRGSFNSTQAIMGKDILLNKGILNSNVLNKDLTYLFEIIYPDNRIVVDYGDTNDMVLLSSFSKYGEEYVSELDRLKPYLNIVKRYDFDDYKSIKGLDWKNSEGFVVRFANGYRVKIKFETYCKLHYVLTGKDVIVDNTHLKESYINQLKSFNVPIKFHIIKCDLDEAIKRDSLRDRQVGAEVITKQYNQLKNLLKTFDFSDWYPNDYQYEIEQDVSLPDAVIFDIDGTLAKMVDRGPFEWHKVFDDDLRLAVYNAYLAHKNLGNKIIICTGRDGCCEQETKEWLEFHGIEYDDFYIRKPNDSRKDFIVKEEMWKEIVQKYHVVCMYDDRDQVVHHGRKLGFDVFQVNYGNF